jgi:MscS family membrane protein
MFCGETLRIESYGERSVGPGWLFEVDLFGKSMTIEAEIADLFSGEEAFYGFSTLGIGFLGLLIGVSVGAGLVSRRVLFPRVMDLFSKTERIDGKSLFAPKSLAWMIGLLTMWQSVDWIIENVSATDGEYIWNSDLMHDVSEICRAGFVILMLIAAYRLVDFLDAFIVVEGDNMAARRSLASVAEAIGRLAVVIVGIFVLAGLVGLNLNGMIAGLGITGLALALAAKDSVANVFGAISIIIDQPFNVGDWIIVEGVEGEVISIGLRTTMIRTGNDTIVTMPNSNITNSPVENFTMRRFRRIRPSFEFEEDSDEGALKKFCDSLCEQVLADPRATKAEDSWVKITNSLPPKITVSCNFYCQSSSNIQREFTEDILLMGRARGLECSLNFHEPRRRAKL